MKNNFSKNIKEYRLSASLTQGELADRLKTTQRKVSYWESGKIEPDLDTLIAIAGKHRRIGRKTYLRNTVRI